MTHAEVATTTDSTTGAPTRPTLHSAPARGTLALSVLAVAALTLAACGGSSSASTSASTAASVPGGGASGVAGTGSSGGAARQFPGTTGAIAAINGTSLEVQSTSAQTTVTYTPTTTFDQTVPATAASVSVGSCISAFGTPTSGASTRRQAFGTSVTARSVTISQPTSGTCANGFGGGGGGFGAGGPAGSGTGAGGSVGSTSGPRPPNGGRFAGRGPGQFGVASGSVTSVSGSKVSVSETNPSTKATSNVVVTLASATTFTQRTSASATDLAVGKCAMAIGSASSTGAVTARSITISSPGANGCTQGFAGFGRANGGAPGAGPGGSPGA